MNIIVKQSRHGPGWELWANGAFVGHFHTNRQAWRRADEMQHEDMSRQERQAEWRARAND